MLATLFVGSSRGPKSTSCSLGSYLVQRLEAEGVNTRTLFIQQSLSSPKGIEDLLRAVELTDVLVLASPLFADSHPAPVIRAMELIHEHMWNKSDHKKRVMIAISNCGFPEAHQNTTSLAISRRFAEECGFTWAGGLALGGGEAIHGKPLEQAGRIARNIQKSLDLTAEALAKREQVPEEAVRLMALPLMPRWLYVQAAHPLLVWLQARKNGSKMSVKNMPYR